MTFGARIRQPRADAESALGARPGLEFAAKRGHALAHAEQAAAAAGRGPA